MTPGDWIAVAVILGFSVAFGLLLIRFDGKGDGPE